MTSDQIQLAIAEKLGWKWSTPRFTHAAKWEVDFCQNDIWKNFDSSWAGKAPPVDECHKNTNQVPDFTESLDACHEFEQYAQNAYWDCLYELIYKDGISKNQPSFNGWRDVLKATPLQRCEAFLRCHGLWGE